MSPYIVTTKRRDLFDVMGADRDRWTEVSSRTVDTLDEARQEVWNDCLGEKGLVRELAYAQLTRFSRSGGTVGPLPDGTLITVERVEP